MYYFACHFGTFILGFGHCKPCLIPKSKSLGCEHAANVSTEYKPSFLYVYLLTGA